MRLLLSLLFLSSHTLFAARVISASSSPQEDYQLQHHRGRKLEGDSRIIGGSDVVPSDRYSFFAFVLADLGSSGSVPCGGTLIHPDIILTAASCVQSDSVKVAVNLSDFDNTEGSLPRTVTATKIHPDFVSATLENDLALLLLDSPILDLALGSLNGDSSVPSEADDVTVIGFGSLSEEDFDPSRVLQGVVLQVSNFQGCNEAYQGQLNADEQLCAGVEEGGKDACFGDAGGPLFVTTGSGEEVIVGLVSGGNGCGEPEFPGFYTRVSYYKDFISSGICSLSAYKPSDCAAVPSPDATIAPVVAPVRSPSAPPIVTPIVTPVAAPVAAPVATTPVAAPSDFHPETPTKEKTGSKQKKAEKGDGGGGGTPGKGAPKPGKQSDSPKSKKKSVDDEDVDKGDKKSKSGKASKSVKGDTKKSSSTGKKGRGSSDDRRTIRGL